MVKLFSKTEQLSQSLLQKFFFSFILQYWGLNPGTCTC
jgi:hypothetical protein